MSINLCVHGVNEKFCVRCVPKKRINSSSLSQDQQEAINVILNNQGCFFFLTGPAGSGKTFVINYLKENVAGCAVCAMTGVAAQLIDGRTAHSFLGMRFPMNDDERSAVAQMGRNWVLSDSKTSARRVQGCRMLIIDEVSMANVEFLQLMVDRFRAAFIKPEEWPKIVLVGDFLQLPPAGGERVFLSDRWLTKVWTIKLTQQHRQIDSAFLSALNEVRIGKVSPEARKIFEGRIVPELPKDCIHLHAYNNDVDNKNALRLNELPGKERVYNWSIKPNDKIDLKREFDLRRFQEATQRADRQSRLTASISLKVDARVILLNNDLDGQWVNGSSGTVLHLTDDIVKIRLDRGNSVVEVERYEEDLLDGTMAIGKIEQFPIRLAWAMTIHKAQGMTLDRVGIDLNDHFSTGQTYVALSRCKYLDTLFLVGKFPDKILVDEDALVYSQQDHQVPQHSRPMVTPKLEQGGLVVDQHVLMRAIPGAPNKNVCILLGIRYPLKAGWRERAIGTVLSKYQVMKLEQYIRHRDGMPSQPNTPTIFEIE